MAFHHEIDPPPSLNTQHRRNSKYKHFKRLTYIRDGTGHKQNDESKCVYGRKHELSLENQSKTHKKKLDRFDRESIYDVNNRASRFLLFARIHLHPVDSNPLK
jgi:hypothetical protein